MRRFDSHKLGVEQGLTVLFSDYQHDGRMWTGNGAREIRQDVTFEEPFASAPMVHVNLSLWDFDKSANQRADIVAEDISHTGFSIVFRVWGDTHVARARAAWIAFGAAPNDEDDDWQLY